MGHLSTRARAFAPRSPPAGSAGRQTTACLLGALLLAGLVPAPASAQAPLRKIGEMELQLAGLQAVLDPVNPVVPRNTPAGVRVSVRAGGRELTADAVALLVGGSFFVEAELGGPGLSRTITIPDLEGGEPLPADPLILPLPGLSTSGDYELSNVRLVSGGRAVMGVLPEVATLKVIEQVLVTKLVTRPLTLDELREKGIEITSRDYTGFQFSLALRLESEVVSLDFPVVFDRKGVVVPQPISSAPTDPTRKVETAAQPRAPAMIVPVMLLPEGEADAGPQVPLTLPSGEPIRIPSVLVIPGNVGYLKQFFSAVVYVANGTPLGSRLFVRDVTGTIQLPPGKDLAPGTPDDPLYLAKRIGEDKPPAERPVLGIGPDETPGTEDDVAVFAPGEQGQAEWVLVGNDQGFHKIDIALGATLDGLPTGPVKVKGGATGGVLVRNPYFDVTFTVPSVVRDGETFKAAITLNNIGQGDGQDVRIALDAARMSGLQLLSPAEQHVDRIPAGEAYAFEYEFKSLRTGKVVATYLRFDAEAGVDVTGRVDFTIGVTDEGVPLSPDTLVLPAAVNLLPGPVSYAAMRVLGQAWSIANAPRGSLPARITRITRAGVEQKALALAEAGLRVTLRDEADRETALHGALRDLLLDFWGGDPVDAGFDRLLRESAAGRAFGEALGEALVPAADAAGGAAALERAIAGVAASGADFLSLTVTGSADVALTDSLGRRTVFERATAGDRANGVPGTALLALGPRETAPLLGLVTQPVATGYRLDVSGPAAITLTAPQAGSFVRGSVNADARAVLAIDLARPGAWLLEQDLDGDGTFESHRDVAIETLEAEGPELLAASIIGSETLPRAGDFGLNAVLVFDRPVAEASASDTSAYTIPKNAVAFAKPQLSGRLVFVTLDQPEGPNFETEVAVSGVADRRGFSRDAAAPLRSRLTRGGAWVTGQVREADGTPIDAGAVVYFNVSDAACAAGGLPQPLARVPLGSDGSYELRYVRQGPCGFEVAAADPDDVLLRRLDARVRRAGERIFLDIVLLGEGAVEGFVRDLAGQAVPGATVAATSETDRKRGGSAVSDASGHYRIEGLPVGLVSVKAGRDAGLGSATGRIERAGTAARIDVSLDSGAVTVSGYFWQVKDGVQQPVTSALVSYVVTGGPAGYAFTDATGFYRLDGMPVGAFSILASGNGPFGWAAASVRGTATAGQVLEHVDLVDVAQPESRLGTVRGVVRLPSGQPAPGVIVARDVSTAFIDGATGTGPDGSFVLNGVPVGVNLSIGAITPDRRRQGHAWVRIDPDTREQDGVEIFLSGIGKAKFTVIGPSGAPVTNQEVSLLGVGGFAGVCRNPCGCRTGTTDGLGTVTFADLPLGAYTAQSVRRDAGFTEAATGTAVLTRDDETGFGTIQLLGSGTVRGSVRLKSTTATFTGGQAALVSRAFVNDGLFTCGMVVQESHRVAVNPLTSSYEFKGVAVGAVSATARTDLGVATSKGNLAKAGETLVLDLEIVDTIAGELSGQVFLPTGTPAGAGVEVTVNGPLPDVTVQTDGASRFVFAKVLPQGNYSITASDPVTGGVVRQSIYLRAGQDLQHDLRLKGRGTVRVKVEDALDQPVDRAFVTLRETDYPQRRHDRAIEPTFFGVATFPDVFEGPFSVEVKDLVGRGGRGSGAVPAPDASVDVTVRLNPTGTVRGTFVLPDGETPIPYALVTLVVNGRRVGQTTTPGTGELIGRFSFDYVPAGPVRVEAEDPLTLRTGFATGTLEAGPDPLLLTVVAKGLGRVQGRVLARVVGGPDEVRPGASVKIQAGSYAGTTLSDADGEYAFGGVPEGAVTVTASVGGQALAGSASGAITADGETLPLDVYLRDSGRVIGRVLRAGGEATAPPSKVTIAAGGIGGGSQETYTREDGVFSFASVATGRATLTAEELGGLDRGRGAVDVVLGESEATVVLNGVGAIVGKAQDASGAPVAGDVWVIGTGAFTWQEFVRVPASGEFRLGKVLAGPVTAKLRAKPGDVTLWGTGTGEVRPDQDNDLVVALAPSGTVTGRVLRARTLVPAYGADVTLLLGAGAGQAAVQADEMGEFVVTGVPVGSFSLRASDPVSGGVALLRDRVLAGSGDTLALGDVVLDDTAPLVQVLAPLEGSTRPGFRGELVVELADDGAGLDYATLLARYPAGLPSGYQDFTFTGSRGVLPLDPYRLNAGLNVIRVSVQDLAGRVGEAEVAFRILGATIRGRVLLPDGAPAPGRPVSVYGASVLSDERGEFVIEGLREGHYYVTATDPGTGLAAQSLVSLSDGGEQSVELQLPAFMRLEGTVVRGSDGLPAEGVRVSTTGAGGLYRQDTTGGDGRFDLGALPLGTYAIEAWIASRLRGRVEDVRLDTPAGTKSVPMTLVVTGTVQGVVTGSSGPASGAAVTLRSLADPWGGYFSVRTGTTGEYAIGDVPAGAFTISASKSGDQVDEPGEMPPTGGLVVKNLELRRSAVTLPLQLADAGGTWWSLQKNGALVTSGTRRVFMAEGATPRLTLVRAGIPTVFTGPDCPVGVTCTVGSEEGQREIVLTGDDVAGLAVVRKVYIPKDGYFARVLDLVRNDGPEAVTVDVLEESDVSSSSVRASSSGDALAQASDRWLVLDDSDPRDIFELPFPTNSFAPTAFVGWGAGARAPDTVGVAWQSSIERTRVTQRWNTVTVPRESTVGILQLVSIQSDQARARASAERLVQLPPEALAGLELDEAEAILNFDVPADLVSALPALAPNDGVVDGSVFGGDRETPIALATVSVRSRSPYFGRPLAATSGSTGAYLVQGRPDQGYAVPRGEPFDVRASRTTGLGSFSATTSGRFALEAGAPAARASVTVAFAGTGVVTGSVRRTDGAVVPSASVRLRYGSASEMAYVGSTGSYRFAPVPAGTLTLTADHPLGSYSFTTPGFTVPGPCSTTADGLRCEAVTKDVVFPAFGAIEGRVTAGPDPALADLELLAEGFRRVRASDPVSGLYRFDDVPPGSYTAIARRRGAAGSVAALAAVVADTVTPLDLALETPTRLTGTLRGGALRPIPWHVVSVVGGTGGEVGRSSSGADGVFVIDGLPKGTFTLHSDVTGSEWGPILRSRFDAPVVLDADEETADALIPVGVLAPGETQLFELTTPAGRPLSLVGSGWSVGTAGLSSFTVYVFGPDGRLAGEADTTWGFARVDIASSQAGRYQVAVHSTASVPGMFRVSSPILDDVHVFRPLAGGLVELTVTRGVSPLAGQAVTVESERLDLPPSERFRSGETGSGGVFRAALADGAVVARVVDPATGVTHEARGTLTSGGTLALTIALPALPSTVRGTVTNGDGRTPLPYAFVTLSGSLSTYSDESGSFRFDDVPPGSYTLAAEFYPQRVEETIVTTGGEYVRELRVPIPVVRGRVLEPDDVPVAGARVEACTTGTPSYCLYSVVTDGSGAFVLYGRAWGDPDPESSLALRAELVDGSGLTVTSAPFAYPASFTGTVVQELRLPQTASLSGTVRDADGHPVKSAAVYVYPDDGADPAPPALRQGVTDGDGLYYFRHFDTARPIRVYAERGWQGSPGERRGTLTLGSELVLDIDLAAMGKLNVGIVDDLGEIQGGVVAVQAIGQPSPAGGVWTRILNLWGEGGPTAQTVQLPVGAYRVVILDADPPGAAEGELVRDETRTERLRHGTHVRLPLPLGGAQGVFVGDHVCPPPCSAFARTAPPRVELFPLIATSEVGGRSLRSLRVAPSGVRVRRIQYAPPSGGFGRTLTLVSNPGRARVTVPFDTVLELDAPPAQTVTASGGPVDPTTPWVVAQLATGVQALVVGAARAPDEMALVVDGEGRARVQARHVLVLEPDDTLALLTFTLVATGTDTAPLVARAEALTALTEPGALLGLTNEERAAIVNFAAPPAGDAAVTVVFGGDAVVGATVGVLDGSGSLVAQATTTPGGTALFAGLAPGTYTIVALDGRERPGRTVVEVTAGTRAADTVTAEVELLADDAMGVVDVAASWDRIGGAAPGVRVVLELPGWSPVWRPLDETDANGLVSFDWLPPGTVLVRPEPASVGAGVSVSVVAGAASPAPLVIEPFASLQGQVVAGDGATPVANAPVTAIDADIGYVLASGRTDASGSYRLDGVRPGPGGVLVRTASPYDAGVTVESDILTPPLPGSFYVDTLALPVGVITGQVSRASGDVRHPAVVASDSSARSILADWTDEFGNFRILGVAGGPVTVIAVDPETGERTSAAVDLDPASSVWLTLFVGPPRGE